MPRPPRIALLAVALLLVAAPVRIAAQPPLRVYISADMEGVAGAVTGEQLGPTGFEYARFREFLTEEVLAAIAGARDAGATEIVVSDSHGNGQNLLIERLPADVTVIRASPRPLIMMQGIDSTFAAVVFIGYHAATTNPAGVRAHTMSSANLAGVALNGIDMPEAGVSAAVAGHFGVPVVMISGDDAAVAEAQRLIGPIEGAVVKRAIGFHSAATMTPQAARTLIREKVKAGVARRAELRPYRLDAPLQLDITFKNYRAAELVSWLPNVQRRDAHTIRFPGRDILEVSRFVAFLLNYEPGINP